MATSLVKSWTSGVLQFVRTDGDVDLPLQQVAEIRQRVQTFVQFQEVMADFAARYQAPISSRTLLLALAVLQLSAEDADDAEGQLRVTSGASVAPPAAADDDDDEQLDKGCAFDFDVMRYLNLCEAVYEDQPAEYNQLGDHELVHFDSPALHAGHPAFALFVDNQSREVVLSIRGTASIKDAVTDLHLAPVELQLPAAASASSVDGDGGVDDATSTELHHVHLGMLHAARDVMKLAQPILQELHPATHAYTFTVCGHSLGGGVAALVAALCLENSNSGDSKGEFFWRQPNRAVLFAPAACVSESLSLRLAAFTTSFVNESDCVPRLTYQGISNLTHDIARLDVQTLVQLLQRDPLVKIISTLPTSEQVLHNGVRQLIDEMKAEAAALDSNARPVQLYPPGVVIHIQNGEYWKRDLTYWTHIDLNVSMVDDHFLRNYRKSLD